MSKVHPQEVQTALIQIFQRWGMPKSVRVDNGMPLGDPQRKSIPELALWLTAIGIEVFFNRPRRPTDNAKVERMQRTTKNWACIEQAKNPQDLGQRLGRVGLIQREHFKVSRLANKTRMQVFPNLDSNSRRYDSNNFDVNKAYQKLATWSFVRKVSSAGQLRMYNQVYQAGLEVKRQYVTLKFDPQQVAWKIFDAQGNHIRTQEASNLKPEHIRNLTVGQRTLKK